MAAWAPDAVDFDELHREIVAYLDFATMAGWPRPKPVVVEDAGWDALDIWLSTMDAVAFIDAAVSGSLPLWEAEELLEEFALAPNAYNLARLGKLIEMQANEF